uniref:F-box/kelch-repeat protein n=1 Tax=Ananas comosus var. bracteatus TaxID=296719 RepID=A0A6V7NVA4_ANACO|nr:unnamed protein product [Ananas comosus var. bracteatus]
MYNSDRQCWEVLPSMNRARKMCSGVFMDGKFYVIGGMRSHTEHLTCGEEYDLERRAWRLVPGMAAGLTGATTGAPPLVAVVGNELYAADYASNELRRYDKGRNAWATLGRLPERSVSMNGWGLAFKACGDRLIVIGGGGLGRGRRGHRAQLVGPDRRGPAGVGGDRQPSVGELCYECTYRSQSHLARNPDSHLFDDLGMVFHDVRMRRLTDGLVCSPLAELLKAAVICRRSGEKQPAANLVAMVAVLQAVGTSK